jgi:hypothetical protein
MVELHPLPQCVHGIVLHYLSIEKFYILYIFVYIAFLRNRFAVVGFCDDSNNYNNLSLQTIYECNLLSKRLKSTDLRIVHLRIRKIYISINENMCSSKCWAWQWLTLILNREPYKNKLFKYYRISLLCVPEWFHNFCYWPHL